MTTQSPLHVVLGATGGAGSAVVRELVRRGHRVRAVNRSGSTSIAGVEAAKADAADPQSIRQAVAGAAVVYHCTNPEYTRWVQEFPHMTQTIIDATADAGAKLVMTDNLYMYGAVDQPMTEDMPNAGTSKKGKVRIRMTEMLLEAHHSGKLPVTIGRMSDFYGPASTSDMLFGPLLQGKTVLWPFGPLDVPHTFSYLDDAARGLVTLGERDEANGQIWHIPAAEPITGRQLLTLAFEIANKPVKIRTIPRWATKIIATFVPIVREIDEVSYQWDRPFIMDTSKYQRVFGDVVPAPHREAIARTLSWLGEHAAPRQIKHAHA